MSPPLPANAPFVGLRPFDQADHRWFYGRARETAALTRQVRDSRFTAVVGTSGSGKSSLVRAGVLVELTKNGWLPIIAKPGSAPIARLAAALSERARDPDEDWLADARSYRFGATLRASAYGLAEIIEKLAPDAPRLVLVIDQFEELFRHGEEARAVQKAALREESRAFVELLLTAATQASGRVHVVITMRSDYFGSCTAYAGLAEAVSASQYLVPLPSRDQLEEGMRRPIEAVGAEMDDALVQRLLIDVEDQRDRLPLLQHTLRRLWDLADGEPRRLREDDYVTVGALAGSIDLKAEDVTKALAAAHPEDALTIERTMKALTTLDEHDRATRRQQTRSELLALLGDGVDPSAAAASLDRVLAALAAEDTSFLQVGEGGDPEIDIGHEALIRGWKRLAGAKLDFASGWLREERDDGEEWRGLVRRAQEGAWLGAGDQRRIARWTKRRGFGPVWSARYGDAWDLVGTMRQRSATRTKFVAALLLALFFAVSWSGWHLIDKRRQAEAESVRHARAGALAAVIVARNFADRGDTRVAALVALGVVPDTRRMDDPRYLAEVDAALAHALSQPIEIMRVRGHAAGVRGVAFSPDRRRLVSASADRTLRLWDVTTGQPVGQPLHGHDDEVSSVAFSPDGRWLDSASHDRTLRIWDADTGQPVGQPLRGHDGPVFGVAFSPDGRWLASASHDKTLRLWDVATRQRVGQPLRGHDGPVFGVVFSSDGRRLASASGDETLRLWDVDTGQPDGQPLRGHYLTVSHVAFSPDGRRLASASLDGMLRLWDVTTRQPTSRALRGHDGGVSGVAFSPSGEQLASASHDKTLRLWDIATGESIGRPLRGHDGIVNGVAFSPDGRRLASASADETLRLWDVTTTQPLGQPLPTDDAWILGVAFSPDGRWLASASLDRTLRLWDGATAQPVGQPLRGHDGVVNSVAFSPDGRRLASASGDRTVRLWDVTTGQPVGQPLRGHDGSVFGVAFSPDGRRLASASHDRTLRLWDAATGEQVGQPLPGHDNTVNRVAFSPDGRRLASASDDRTLRLWDGATGQPVGQSLRGHDGPVLDVAFSPDGRRLASASADSTLRLWDVVTGQPVGQPLRTHDGPVIGVAFSPDGRRLASASLHKAVRLWDVATGQPIGQPLLRGITAFSRVAFSPDGRRLASASGNAVRIWNAGHFTSALRDLADGAKELCPLSRAERERLHLFDPRFGGRDTKLTVAQRRACGEPVSAAAP
jgi:WD40 repeat protein